MSPTFPSVMNRDDEGCCLDSTELYKSSTELSLVRLETDNYQWSFLEEKKQSFVSVNPSGPF